MTLSVLTIMILHGCASFQDSSVNKYPLTSTSIARVNGVYQIQAEKDSLIDSIYLKQHNAFEKFYRGKGQGSRDTMDIENLEDYSFKLLVLASQAIQISYIKGDSIFREFSLQFKLGSDGYIYLKNENLKILGVPYLFGGIDERRLRITKEDGYLIIEEVYHRSGAALFIIGDSKTWNYITKYKEI